MTKEEFKHLFDKHFDAVRSYLVYRGADTEVAADLAQDVFMKIWEKQILLDQKETLPLLYKIAKDMFISKYRRNKLEVNYLNSIQIKVETISPEDEIRRKELLTNYKKALAGLNDKQRMVFLMSRMEGLKYKEIAERLNLSVKAVEKRMNLALTYLKKELEN